MTDELSSEESERFFARLERNPSLGRRDWAGECTLIARKTASSTRSREEKDRHG